MLVRPRALVLITGGCGAAALRPGQRPSDATVHQRLRRGLLSALPACLLIFFLSLPTVLPLASKGWNSAVKP